MCFGRSRSLALLPAAFYHFCDRGGNALEKGPGKRLAVDSQCITGSLDVVCFFLVALRCVGLFGHFGPDCFEVFWIVLDCNLPP